MVSEESSELFNEFVKQLEQILEKLNKPLKWQSFLLHDLPLLMDIHEEVQKDSIQMRLNKTRKKRF